MPPTTTQLVQDGIAAARAGQRAQARALLMDAVSQNERNPLAWLWLAGVVDDPADVRVCLENVLDLDPSNAAAQRGLASLGPAPHPPATGGGTDAPPRTGDPTWSPAPAAAQTPAPAAAPARAPAAAQTDRSPAPAAAQIALPTLLAPEAQQPTRQPERARQTAPSAAAHQTSQPAPTAPQPSAAPALPADAASDECPYCGAVNNLEARRCAKCRESLMVTGPRNELPSVWLWIMVGLYVASGAASIAGLVTALSWLGSRNMLTVMPLMSLLIIVAAGVLSAAFNLIFAWRLWKRGPIAYALNAIGALFSAVGGIIGLLLSIFLPAALMTQRNSLQLPNESGSMLPVALGASFVFVLYVAVAVLSLGWALVVFMARKDFFSQKIRGTFAVLPADDRQHFNNGLDYKRRGMWHLAMREWERAAARAPRDTEYADALGLAYAQLGKYEQAFKALDAGLKVAPEHPRLTASRALVEQMAQGKR